jgi:hypothetical protein
MTVIATDGRTMAADGRFVSNALIVETRAVKLHRRQGRIFGFGGNQAQAEIFLEWLDGGAPADKRPSLSEQFGAIEINENGVWIWESTCIRLRHSSPYATLGTGSEIALAALYLGKTPREAVELACTLDVWCGGEITEMSLDDPGGQ